VQATNASLLVNPRMELIPVKAEGTVGSITVRAPVKGWGLKVTTIDRKEPGIFGALLVHMMTGDTLGKLAADESRRLQEIGFLVAPEAVANPVWYSCDVLDPPLDLVPRRVRNQMDRTSDLRDLVVNPTLQQFGSDGPPQSMRGRIKLGNRFDPDRSWLWLQEPDVRAPSLYSFRQERSRHVEELVAGRPAPDSLDLDTRRLLHRAGVLESAADAASRRESRASRITRARAELHGQRYTALRHVIAPLQLAAARRYYHDAITEGFLVPGDAEWPNRPFSSRDAIANFFHTHLNGLISDIAGVPLQPSFSFFASYRTGAELKAHRDRAQCEYAISILVDFSPEPDDLSPWPIFVQAPDAPSATPVSLGLGDAVLYYGREVRHHREVLQDADSSSSWFFFYVAEDFDGPLD
jgi:hypothetical protein